MSRNRRLAYSALLLNAVIWGAALPIVKPALSHVTPYQYLFYRYLLAVPLSFPILIYLFRKFKPKLKTILTIVGLELLAITGALSFLYEGLKRTSSLEATLIANAAPVFIIIGGITFLKEKEERHELIGLIFALIGMGLLTFEPLITGRNGSLSFSITGNFLVLGHNLFWASYVLLAKKFYRNISKLLIGSISLWVGLISFLILTFITTPGLTSASDLFGSLAIPLMTPSVFFAALYMAILGSIVAVPLYIFGNNLIEASEASLFSYLQPLIAIPLATLWLKESINFVIILALVLTTSGVIAAQKRAPRLVKPSKT